MEYDIEAGVPEVEEYRQIREAAGLSSKSAEAARRGLPNTIYGATAVRDDEPVGMGRIIGDGGTAYQIVDVAVLPEHQGRGIGTRIVKALMTYLHEHAPSSAYVSLMADVDDFYEQFGFEYSAPASKGMALWIQ